MKENPEWKKFSNDDEYENRRSANILKIQEIPPIPEKEFLDNFVEEHGGKIEYMSKEALADVWDNAMEWRAWAGLETFRNPYRPRDIEVCERVRLKDMPNGIFTGPVLITEKKTTYDVRRGEWEVKYRGHYWRMGEKCEVSFVPEDISEIMP